MTSPRPQLETLGDPALAELARSGDTAAFAELWRRHAAAGTMAARQFASIADPQDIVSEAYLRIWSALQRGGGPHEAFRPYLYRTVRNIALDWRSRLHSVPLDETDEIAEAMPSIETTVLDNTVTAKAFEQLPERWQAVLWYLEVEGMSPSEVAPMLGLSPNATSVLAGRAHEGFKKAWLQAHVNDRSVPAECQWTTERMSGYVRHSLTKRSRTRFDRHLGECDRCAILVQEIGDLGGQLASILLPVALGSVAGSLLLGQLRDHAASTVASSVLPLAVPAGSMVLRGAAAVVIVSGALLAPAAVEQKLPPGVSAGGQASADGTATASGSDPLAAVPQVPDAEDAPVEPAPASAVDAEPIAAAPQPVAPVGHAEPAAVGNPALVDVSLSLLSGAVTVDAEVELAPVTDLIDAVLPGLPGISLPGISLLGG